MPTSIWFALTFVIAFGYLYSGLGELQGPDPEVRPPRPSVADSPGTESTTPPLSPRR